MKTIGLIGGMSWESTVTYYQLINQTVQKELGGFHSAKCLLCSVDFHEIEECQSKGDWKKSSDILSAAAISLERAGADFIIICTNTMHKVADQVQSAIHIPLLHIADVTANALIKKNIYKVALLGTKYTMQQDFYKQRLVDHGIDVIIPSYPHMDQINHMIFSELCLGVISMTSKNILLEVIREMKQQGAEGIILGCTELGLLLSQKDTPMPVFDTALLHASEAASYSLQN